jgi:nickel-dependent lactate racemase
MRIDLRYGATERSILIPGDLEVEYVEPNAISAFDDPAEALGRALKAPIASEPLSARFDARQRVLVVITDPTRSGTGTMLPVLVEALDRMGVDHSRLSILVARGTHRSLTKEEKQFLRTGPLRSVRIEEHDCDDSGKLSALLLTKRHTPVRVNRAVREADIVILLSPISFHYFAGFGGGRKLILPGCADRPSILANHRLSLSSGRPVHLHPSCGPGRMDGNPVHEDMMEALAALENIFAVNFFCDTLGRPTFVNSGDPALSHAEACEAFAEVHRVNVKKPVGVLLLSAGGWPYDVNLLQAHKALFHGCQLVPEGGVVLLHAACGEGVGSQSLVAALEKDEDKFLATAYENYDLNNQTAVSLLGLTRRRRVGMVTELDMPLLQSAGIEHVDNAEAFLASALEQRGTNSVAVMRFGAQTLPIIPGSEER